MYAKPIKIKHCKKIFVTRHLRHNLRHPRMLDREGIPYDEISTHSYRKGSAIVTASGSTATPPIVVICLRAGWKLSGVLNTYLSLENAGDRFVGRVCALLPQMSREFGVLPPSFTRANQGEVTHTDRANRLISKNDPSKRGHQVRVYRYMQTPPRLENRILPGVRNLSPLEKLEYL